MKIDEEKYLEYRESKEQSKIEEFNCFKYPREILIITRSGELEEIKVEGYHFESLYERFKEYEEIDKYDEYITSCVAAKNGFIVFLIDPSNLSMFYPYSITKEQKETLTIVLNNIPNNAKVYAGIIENSEELELKEWNNGEEVLISIVKSLIDKMPLSEELMSKR